jgi:transcriptional regulator with XRE-family HTH domain
VTIVTTIVNRDLLYDCGVSKNSLRESVNSNVAQLLRKARQDRGLSMNVVAQRSGLSHSIISLIERDLRSPTLDTLLRIADAVEIDLGQVITKARKEAAKATK